MSNFTPLVLFYLKQAGPLSALLVLKHILVLKSGVYTYYVKLRFIVSLKINLYYTLQLGSRFCVGVSGIITNVIIINIIAILIIISNYYYFIYFLFSFIIIITFSSIINPVNTVWESYPRWNPRELSCLTSLTLCTVCVSAACGVWLHLFRRLSDSEGAAEVRHPPR